MRTLDFNYDLHLVFDRPVSRHSFMLRFFPLERDGQHIQKLQYRIDPSVPVSEDIDGFGNRYCFGLANAPHTDFAVSVNGTVLLDNLLQSDIEWKTAIYKQQTLFTQPGDHIQKLFTMTSQHSDKLEHALLLMKTVRSEIAYIPESTTVFTTAEQAAAQGCGVCQDHTQIMLSLLRLAGIPCRYTAGFLLGEGRTHAWAEAFIHGHWIGLDATNGTLVQDTHIAVSVGRDHTDCELNRGVMLGSCSQCQTVHVHVKKHSP